MGWKDLEIIFEAVDCGVCILDATGIMIKINPGLPRHTDLPAELFLNRHILSLYDQHHFEHIPIGYRGLSEARTIHGVQKTRTGKTLLATATPVFGGNRKLKYVVLDAREISESAFSVLDVQSHGRQRRRDTDPSGELASRPQGGSCLIAQSDAMAEVMGTAKKVASTDATVLLVGESGVGKDLIAEYIWRNSLRFGRGGFIRLNCNSMPRDLVESELFGYTAGTFTGGRKDGKPGLLEMLSGGTLFLDEIADLPLELQGKFLDVLERGAFRRLGGISDVYTDVRIIAATNRHLWEMVENGLFRKDLYYRLNVVYIPIPPLRVRPEDILPLAEHYVDRFNKKYGARKLLAPETNRILQSYHWPGNVRELANLLECLVITMADGVIEPKSLTSTTLGPGQHRDTPVLCEPLKDALQHVEKKILETAREEHGTSRRIGEALGISHTTVNKKLKRYGLAELKK